MKQGHGRKGVDGSINSTQTNSVVRKNCCDGELWCSSSTAICVTKVQGMICTLHLCATARHDESDNRPTDRHLFIILGNLLPMGCAYECPRRTCPALELSTCFAHKHAAPIVLYRVCCTQIVHLHLSLLFTLIIWRLSSADIFSLVLEHCIVLRSISAMVVPQL